MKPKSSDKAPVITVTFEKPVNGYWDGGKKAGGTFTPTLERGGLVQWGSWGLNVWYRLPFGKSWKDAATRAKNKIKRDCKINCTLEVLWAEQ